MTDHRVSTMAEFERVLPQLVPGDTVYLATDFRFGDRATPEGDGETVVGDLRNALQILAALSVENEAVRAARGRLQRALIRLDGSR